MSLRQNRLLQRWLDFIGKAAEPIVRRTTPETGQSDHTQRRLKHHLHPTSPDHREKPAIKGHATTSAAPSQATKLEQPAPLSGRDLDLRTLEAEQQALLAHPPQDMDYSATLQIYVRAKYEQVERIEEKLKTQEAQAARALRTIQMNQPGPLSRPSTRRTWAMNRSLQTERLLAVQNRLNTVHTIKEGMNLHSPRLDEMAVRKLRFHHSELAKEWEMNQEGARRARLLSAQPRRLQRAPWLALGIGLDRS